MNAKRVAAFAAAVLAALGPCPVAASCLATPIEDRNPTNGARTGIAQPAAEQLWISGTVFVDLTRTYPYVERYERSAGWSTSLLSELQDSAFNSITAFTVQHAIAVGFDVGGADALAVAFDGAQWRETLGANSRTRYRGSLQKVFAVPDTSTAYAVLAYGAYNLLYWNGAVWSAVGDALPLGGVLAVGASAADDVWAVGGKTDALGVVHGLVERYDGRQWAPLHPPAALTLLTGVQVRRGDDVWVTGLTQHGPSFSPYAAHWDGRTWAPVDSLPLRNTLSAVYGDVYEDSASSLWISAGVPQRGGGMKSSLWHWNGRRWEFVVDSAGWSQVPMLAGHRDDVWFSAGAYRRTRIDGNRWLGLAACAPTLDENA